MGFAGLVGKNDWESAQCDEIGDTMGDMFAALRNWRFEEDAEKKVMSNVSQVQRFYKKILLVLSVQKSLRDKVDNDHIKPLLTKMENRLKERGTGYLISDDVGLSFLLFRHYSDKSS